ncbi:MAG TPA: flagellar filament capping protein FliD [Povalibacter sp.]|uniref:flagellar filament capping protein FliD n=1 Tax=Povalibacter sp. TaxID=1962978 RepID=UPI002B828229|nr:flagellar filament capping protein FliD [Povalibacter sp.]HMN43151.1 flagellar filament capping protein FliD [Povalibacter sp.]
MPDFDPVTIASQLATAYVQSSQDQIAASKAAAQRTATGLTTLRSALSAFDSAVSGLTSGSSGMRQFGAQFSASGIGTATASSGAQAGTYSFHVEQLAQAHQVVFEDLPAVPVALGGPITVQLGDGSSFSVNLVAADSDGDGSISQAEIARAINQAEDNGGKVTASLMTVGGETRLLLSAASTGAGSEITLDTSALPAGALKDAFDGGQELVAARDAVVWLGGQGGIRLQQASNTFTAIEGVSVTFTRAMQPAESPVTLAVTADSTATAANVQKFIDAYNTLKTSLDNLTKVSKDGATAAGAFATDAGVRALRSRLNSIIRQEFGGLTLAELGVTATRTGSLSLDKTRLDKTLAANPTALEDLFGKASLTQPTGLIGTLDRYFDAWLKSGSGQIAGRQSSVEIIQKRLTERQTRLDAQYDNVYERYLKQFTQLQALQSQMGQTAGLFSTMSTSS